MSGRSMLRLGLLLSLLGLVSLLSLPLLFNRQEPGERQVDAQLRVLLTALQSYESQIRELSHRV